MEKPDKQKLRFGALIRVSTEPQERQGTSLKTQREQITRAVKALGGTIIGFYGGAEHATIGWERKEVNRLITDALAGKVSAVIVATSDRWSRDNRKSKDYLDILRDHDIGFFVGTQETNLFSPEQFGMLSLGVEMAEFWAESFRLKALMGKLQKARAGFPPVNKLPYGRLFDRKAQVWTIDKEKKRIAERMAKDYLSKEGFKSLGKKYGMCGAAARNVLLHAGEDFVIHYHVPKFKIDEKITIKVPRLLSDETIAKIIAKAETRKKWDRGTSRPEKYPLSGFLFDGESGLAINGNQSNGGRHYRYPNQGQGPGYYFNAKRIEDAVSNRFEEVFRDPKQLYKAIFGDTDISKDRQVMEQEKIELDADLERNRKKIQTLIRSIEEATDLPTIMSSIKTRMGELENQGRDIQGRIQALDARLNAKAKEAEVATQARWLTEELKKRHKENWIKSGAIFKDRDFLRLVFSGKDSTGRRYGVYLWPEKSHRWNKGFKMEILGKLGEDINTAQELSYPPQIHSCLNERKDEFPAPGKQKGEKECETPKSVKGFQSGS